MNDNIAITDVAITFRLLFERFELKIIIAILLYFLILVSYYPTVSIIFFNNAFN